MAKSHAGSPRGKLPKVYDYRQQISVFLDHSATKSLLGKNCDARVIGLQSSQSDARRLGTWLNHVQTIPNH